ncbi:MAG: FHA domain-containing protein [Thermoanaerobaculia bacterium]
MRLSFGPFVFDSGMRALFRDGTALDLSPKALTFLEILIAARPAPVSKQILYDKLWPKTFVETGNLHNLASEVRKQIGDDDRAVIRTVHGFGYAFSATATQDAQPSQFGIDMGGRLIRLHRGENIIGRERDATISVQASYISRQHARLLVSPHEVVVEDLGSKNGTYVGDERLTAPRTLRDGDTIKIGATVMVLRHFPEALATETLA